MAKPTLEAVRDTVREFDSIGRDAFFRKYDFADRNITYQVEIDGQIYPSKAIYGAAFARMPGEIARNTDTCDGKEAREHLARLGLRIVAKGERQDQPVSTAQRIRSFVIDRIIAPARQRGDATVAIVSGDVHRDMALVNQMPTVCNTLEGRIFAEQAGVTLIDRTSPIDSDKPSSTIRYRFDLQSGSVRLNMEMLDRLKAAFLEKHPGFVTFADCPSFAASEGDYKQALVDRAAQIMRARQDATDAELGSELLELVGGRAGLASNLIDWRAMEVVDETRVKWPGVVESAAGALARAADGEAAAVQFVATVWPGFVADRPSKPFAESRMVPTMIRALVKPDVLPIRSTPTDNAASMLLGGRAFGSNPLEMQELQKVDAMAREVLRVMDDDWGWGPRSLWDVQGFFWETCQKRLGEPGKLDPIPVWLVTSRWGDEDGLPRFIERGEWSLVSDTGGPDNRRVREMHVGDRIFLRDYVRQKDLPFDANGKIVTGYRFRAEGTITETSADGMRVGVEWEPIEPVRIWYFYTNNDLVWRLLNPGKDELADRLRRFLLDGEKQDYDWFLKRWHNVLFGTKEEQTMAIMPKPENLILYGPPGTGKTYRTAKEAVSVCDGAADFANDAEGRAALMARYRELVRARRIEFVTFHQNFSYEDFVEGLRPSVNSDAEESSGGFELKPEPGIFRRIAERANAPVVRSADSFSLADRNIFKISLGEVGKAKWEWVFEESLAEGFAILGYKDVDWSDARFEDRDAILKELQARYPEEAFTVQNGPVKSPDRFRNHIKIGDVLIVGKGLNAFRAIGVVEGNYEYHPRPDGRYCHRRRVRWLWCEPEGVDVFEISEKRFSLDAVYPLTKSKLNVAEIERLINLGEAETEADGVDGFDGHSTREPHVLIIDEINRANISKVFGELITLLEPDKRLGQTNALTVRLPYSKKEFGVPSNLHVIGTMNTADRSIALLDTALRRRFRFVELAPDASVLKENVDGIELQKVLRVMNERIEYLIDRDHCLGHALFMGEDPITRDSIEAAMRDKVIPLLAEYFFEDWSKIALVVGDGFLAPRTLKAPPGDKDGQPRTVWSVREIFEKDAYESLLKGSMPDDEQLAAHEGDGQGA